MYRIFYAENCLLAHSNWPMFLSWKTKFTFLTQGNENLFLYLEKLNTNSVTRSEVKEKKLAHSPNFSQMIVQCKPLAM